MADGDFCDFPPGMDPHIIAQLQNFSQRAGAENFGKRGHCNLMGLHVKQLKYVMQINKLLYTL
jgi:hypothetical protein